jgi:DNA-binding GntR family transcriptional regulator
MLRARLSTESSVPRAPRAANGRNGRAAEDRVFNAILDAVLDHRLAPGTKLKERELAEIFSVSRNAARSALLRLGHSLLVELRPNRGAVIANPSVEETRDLFEARRVIEAAVLRRLAAGLDADKRARLRAFVAEEQKAYDRGDLKTGQRLSIQFHKLLSELAGNRVLDAYMESLIARTPLLALAYRGSQLAFCGAHDHREMVEALARGDAERAVKRMGEHLKQLESQLRLEPGAPTASLRDALGGAPPAAGAKKRRGAR